MADAKTRNERVIELAGDLIVTALHDGCVATDALDRALNERDLADETAPLEVAICAASYAAWIMRGFATLHRERGDDAPLPEPVPEDEMVGWTTAFVRASISEAVAIVPPLRVPDTLEGLI